MPIRLLVFLLLLVSLPVHATGTSTDTEPAAEAAASPAAATVPPGKAVPGTAPHAAPTLGGGVSSANPFSVLFALALILALIFASAWVMKRLGGINVSGNGMKVLTGMSVGPREKVLLLEVGDKQILIGVASGNVSHLQTFDTPVIEVDSAAPGDFSQRLRALVAAGGKRGGGQP